MAQAIAEEIPQDIKSLREEIERKTGKSPDELYEEREKRVRDAVNLREPDRVPVVLGGVYTALRFAGLPCSTAYYDPAAYKRAFRNMILDFEPDSYGAGAIGTESGRALEILGSKTIRWPGYNLPPDTPNQILEPVRMKDDEYDVFLNDPTDFHLRYYLPRVYSVYEPLANLPHLWNTIRTGAPTAGALFTDPRLASIGEAVKQAEVEAAKYRAIIGNADEELALLGFPADGQGQGIGGPPFDVVSNNFRGMRVLVDMLKQPDKLLAAIDKVMAAQLKRGVPADPNKRGNPKKTGGAIHRGSDEFMSPKHWETFYWPSYKKVLLRTIELGYVASVFCEGRCESRLESFLDMPKKSMVLRFSYTDMARAKEVLGDHQCIMGNVPPSLLQIGSVSEVEDYCKNLIKVCGKHGGFILRAGTDSLEDARPANVKAMVDSVKKWGVY